MSRKLFDVMQRGSEVTITALMMFVSLAVFWPIAFAHRRHLLR
jgi:hypothetical protein